MPGDRFEVESAGTKTRPRFRPEAIAVMKERASTSPSPLQERHEFRDTVLITVLTVCDNANESCPIYPGHANRLHHSFEDPAPVKEQRAAPLCVSRGSRSDPPIFAKVPGTVILFGGGRRHEPRLNLSLLLPRNTITKLQRGGHLTTLFSFRIAARCFGQLTSEHHDGLARTLSCSESVTVHSLNGLFTPRCGETSVDTFWLVPISVDFESQDGHAEIPVYTPHCSRNPFTVSVLHLSCRSVSKLPLVSTQSVPFVRTGFNRGAIGCYGDLPMGLLDRR